MRLVTEAFCFVKTQLNCHLFQEAFLVALTYGYISCVPTKHEHVPVFIMALAMPYYKQVFVASLSFLNCEILEGRRDSLQF